MNTILDIIFRISFGLAILFLIIALVFVVLKNIHLAIVFVFCAFGCVIIEIILSIINTIINK